MDDGRERHARHVRGLVAASEVLARPGLSAGGRLRRLAEVTDAAIAGHRTAVFVSEEGGGFHVQHRIGPALMPDAERDELALLSDPPVLEQLLARRVVVLVGDDRAPGRNVLVFAPMTLEGDLWGCLSVEGKPGGAQRADDLTKGTLSGVANMGAHILLAEHLRTDRAEVLSRDLLTEQRNRRRISNRLHDGPQQILVSLRMRLQMLERDASDELAGELHRLADYVEAARDDLRALILDLDTLTGHTVLSNALRTLLETNASVASWQTTFEADDGVDDVNEETQLTIERVVQEALANARQHADASHVSLQLRRTDGMITVVITDDGTGIPAHVPTTSTGNSGIRAMHERIWLIGGTLHIDSGPGRGTRAVLTAPRHA
jgi:signal transduction histidine kinase